MWDVIKHAIESTGRTVRLIAIIVVLAAVVVIAWRAAGGSATPLFGTVARILAIR